MADAREKAKAKFEAAVEKTKNKAGVRTGYTAPHRTAKDSEVIPNLGYTAKPTDKAMESEPSGGPSTLWQSIKSLGATPGAR